MNISKKKKKKKYSDYNNGTWDVCVAQRSSVGVVRSVCRFRIKANPVAFIFIVMFTRNKIQEPIKLEGYCVMLYERK